MFPEMNKVWLVLLEQLRRHVALANAPEEIHLGVRGAERQSRFKNQKYAAIEQETSSNQTQHHGNPTVARAGNCDQADGHAGSYKHGDRDIKSRQSTLQQARSAGQLSQLIENHRPPLLDKFRLRWIAV